MNANILEKANQILKTGRVAYVGVIDENGFPSVSTVLAVKPCNESGDSGACIQPVYETYFATGLASNKVSRLTKDKRASICFHVGGDNITLVGEAEILTDQHTKSRYWQKVGFIEHFPGGETDPNYCIVRIKTKRVSLWVDGEDAEFMLDDESC